MHFFNQISVFRSMLKEAEKESVIQCLKERISLKPLCFNNRMTKTSQFF